MTAHRLIMTYSLTLIALFTLAAIGWFSGSWKQTEQKPGLLEYMLASAESHAEPTLPCMDEETKEIIRGLMQEALETALRQHVVHAFEVWMKDPTGQPGRAKTGVERGVRAYIEARKGVLVWEPPQCPS